MPDVFVVHSSSDDDTATEIHEALTAQSVDTWVDHEDSMDISRDKDNRHALETCRMGLFLLSADSVASLECLKQVQQILGADKSLAIVSVDQSTLSGFPDSRYARQVHYFDYTRDRTSVQNRIVAMCRPEPLTVPASAPTLSGSFPYWQFQFEMVGLENEKQQVLRLFEEGVRIVMLNGMSGIGKSRLAAEIAQRAAFPHGVIWFEITAYATIDNLTRVVRDHLHLPENYTNSQVWAQLGQRAVLLVLDNADRCTQQDAFAERLNALDTGGGTRVLMTSRQRWRTLPDLKRVDLRLPKIGTAVEILRVMANRQGNLKIDPEDELRLVRAACFRPTLIAKALDWMSTIPDIRRVIDLLNKGGGSERASKVFDELVSETLRNAETSADYPEMYAAMRRLVVCRGSFSFNAAQALIPDPLALQPLHDWGLLTIDQDGRYTVDPLLVRHLEPDETARPIHFNFFLNAAESAAGNQRYATLAPELDNLEAAFSWAIAQADIRPALRLADACSEFLATIGHHKRRLSWYEDLGARLPYPLDEPARDLLTARVQVGLGVAYLESIKASARKKHLQNALAMFERASRFFRRGAPYDYAMTQNNLGIVYRNLAEIEAPAENLSRAIEHFKQAERAYTAHSNLYEYAAIFNNLGAAYLLFSRYGDRKTRLHDASACFRKAMSCLHKAGAEETAPLHWAMTISNYGALYAEMADVSDSDQRAEFLRKSQEMFVRAGHFLSAENTPIHYARLRANNGHMYSYRASVHKEPDNLLRAKREYELALEILTREEAPLLHAELQLAVGSVCLDLAVFEDRDDYARQAKLALALALEFYTPRTNGQAYGKALVLMGRACKLLGEIEAANRYWRKAEDHFDKLGWKDYAERMGRFVSGETDPNASRSASQWVWRRDS